VTRTQESRFPPQTRGQRGPFIAPQARDPQGPTPPPTATLAPTQPRRCRPPICGGTRIQFALRSSQWPLVFNGIFRYTHLEVENAGITRFQRLLVPELQWRCLCIGKGIGDEQFTTTFTLTFSGPYLAHAPASIGSLWCSRRCHSRL
jgi:hypothetical protein